VKQGMIIVTMVVLFAMGGVACGMEDGLGVDVDVTWVSKYVWRGIDILDDKAATQPSITLDLYGTGLSFNAWASYAGSSKGGSARSTVDAQEWDYTLTYANSIFDGQTYKTNYAASWIYYDFPDKASKDGDMQEFNLGLSWPEVFPFGVVPSYVIAYSWPAKGGGIARSNQGFAHVFGLSYSLEMADLPNPLNFNFTTVYNDGCGGAAVKHDWSHILWSVSTPFDGPMGGTITPAVYYQKSMEETINTEDELWIGVSYGLSF